MERNGEKRRSRLGVDVLGAFTGCPGRVVVLGRSGANRGQGAEPETMELEHLDLRLARSLRPFDAQGGAPVVVLRVLRRGDEPWLAAAVPWLGQRGRRVVVSTAATLRSRTLDLIASVGAGIAFELAGTTTSEQRALLGDHADSASRLLLQGQFARVRSIPVFVRFGPVVPTIHDRSRMGALWRHMSVAAIRDAHVAEARWSPRLHRRLATLLPSAELAAVARSYGVFDPSAAEHESSLLPARRRDLLEAVYRKAETSGIEVDACGCPVQCHLFRPAGPYLSLSNDELFPTDTAHRAAAG